MPWYERKAILTVFAADADEAESAFQEWDGMGLPDVLTKRGENAHVSISVDDGVPEEVNRDD